MTYTCPKDPTHRSDDADYCSVCGAKIQGAGVTPDAPAPVTAPAPTICPDCGTPRVPGARFCEVCRHDFAAGMAGTPPASAPVVSDAGGVRVRATYLPPEPGAVPLPEAVPPPTGASSAAWEAVIAVDPSLYTEPDPNVPCPTQEPARTFPLDLADNLIGRRSDRKDIHPEIPLNDPGASHRHAKLSRAPDGGLVLLDVGSTNGTQVNGADVAAGVRVPVGDGDQITLGCWTRITVRKV